MRLTYVLLLLLGSIILPANKREANTIDPNSSLEYFSANLNLEKDAVYVFLRGTNTKLSGFAKDYNSWHPKASHVALAIYTDSLRVYHVNTTQSKKDNLITETLASFTHHPEQKHTYFGVWKLPALTKEELQKIEQKILEYKTMDVRFDYRFDNLSEEKLYCSEFVYKVMTHANSERFKLDLSTIEVPKEHRFFLKKDRLEYYPTDFFFEWPDLRCIGEWTLAER